MIINYILLQIILDNINCECGLLLLGRFYGSFTLILQSGFIKDIANKLSLYSKNQDSSGIIVHLIFQASNYVTFHEPSDYVPYLKSQVPYLERPNYVAFLKSSNYVPYLESPNYVPYFERTNYVSYLEQFNYVAYHAASNYAAYIEHSNYVSHLLSCVLEKE